MLAENCAIRLQLACTSLHVLNTNLNVTGRMIANACQWMMILYAATGDVISPPIILSLGTIVFIMGNLDVAIEICLHERRM